MKKYIWPLSLFVIDITLKQIALNTTRDFFLVPKFFAFKLYQNPALAFSLPLPQFFIVIFSFIILIGLIIFTYKKPAYFFITTLILLGSLSNLFDRLNYGFVIDYLYLYPISYFNLADLLIFIGVFWLTFKIFQHDYKKI